MPDLEIPADVLAEFEASLDADIRSWTEELLGEMRKRPPDEGIEKFNPDQARDEHGMWTLGGSGSAKEAIDSVTEDELGDYSYRVERSFNRLARLQRAQLSAKQKGELVDYLSESYQDINLMLRTGQPTKYADPQDVQDSIQTLQKVVEAAKLPEPAVLFRGARLDSNAVSKLRLGSTITDKAFVSTSLDLGIAVEVARYGAGSGGSIKGTPVLFRINAPKGTAGLVCKGSWTSKDESEVLLSAGSRFRVTSVDRVGGRNFKGLVVSMKVLK